LVVGLGKWQNGASVTAAVAGGELSRRAGRADRRLGSVIRAAHPPEAGAVIAYAVNSGVNRCERC
jgi:hypothetical protein